MAGRKKKKTANAKKTSNAASAAGRQRGTKKEEAIPSVECVMCSSSSDDKIASAESVFTSACSHSFHLRCIALKGFYDGGYLCPTCGSKLTNLPDLQPYYPVFPKPKVSTVPLKPLPPLPAPIRFSDDEPLPAPISTYAAADVIAEVDDVVSNDDDDDDADSISAAQADDDVTSSSAVTVALQNVTIRAVPEHDAVAASESVPNFSVLVGLRAPPLSGPRTPIDLVMVLDVSRSMHFGSKLVLVKQAAAFVVDNLGPSDRLSLISFSNTANRVLSLRTMTEQGRAHAKSAIASLAACGTHTNIFMALDYAARVLDERLHRNQASSVMFLSDGNDTWSINRRPSDYLPASIDRQKIPIYSFGFGADHDPILMHAVSDSSGGTFSFVEVLETVNDAFARCIGGLLSVVVRDLVLTLKSASNGVVIKSIPSGTHASEVSESRASVKVGELYADEEKEFLINISIPTHVNTNEDEDEQTTPLLDIECSYKDVLSNEIVGMEFVEIGRPGVALASDVKVKIEVDRERNRLDAAEGFAEAQRAAEAGDLKGARAILSKRRLAILASESGQAGDGVVVKIEEDMKETEERMGSKRKYEEAGRAYALSTMSAHASQRATTRRRASEGDAYETPSMANMVNKCLQIVKVEKEEYD